MKFLKPPSDQETKEAFSKMTPEQIFKVSLDANYLDGVKLSIKSGFKVDSKEIIRVYYFIIYKKTERRNNKQKCNKEDYQILKYIIENFNLDLNDTINHNMTLLDLALLDNNKNMVKYLVKHGAKLYPDLLNTPSNINIKTYIREQLTLMNVITNV
jgi:hypothetical protein